MGKSVSVSQIQSLKISRLSLSSSLLHYNSAFLLNKNLRQNTQQPTPPTSVIEKLYFGIKTSGSRKLPKIGGMCLSCRLSYVLLPPAHVYYLKLECTSSLIIFHVWHKSGLALVWYYGIAMAWQVTLLRTGNAIRVKVKGSPSAPLASYLQIRHLETRKYIK